ncbi:MAG: tetratricopeptide repeat protein [Haliscomenobacter sp.]|nr:tetratricopeptide repeat protein [Haliscomenobacter sp.]
MLDVLGRSQEAIPYFEEGLALSQKRKDSLAMADYRINPGVTWYQLGVYDKSLENYLSAYHIYEALGDREKLSKVLNNIGIMYLEEKSYDRAIDIYQKSIGIKQELSDSSGLAATYQNLGSAYDSKKDEEKAISNLKKALQIYELLDRPRDAAGCRVSLGKAYLDFGKRQRLNPFSCPLSGFTKPRPIRNTLPLRGDWWVKLPGRKGILPRQNPFLKRAGAGAILRPKRNYPESSGRTRRSAAKLNKPAEALLPSKWPMLCATR